ncbi:MAG: SPFH domain-containing protein [Ruminococcaceae bacterium]|nr:SPFH domain-containing protein [Oscillospiraceae bacterium]
MGLLKAGFGALGGVLADSWRDYFYCESMDSDTLVVKGEKRAGDRSSNKKGTDNIISNGSIINVNDGQCMIIVESGKVVELCADPGEFVYDMGTEPSIFYGKLGENIKKSFSEIGKRFTFGGEPAKDQRVYFFNTKEIMGNKYGTPSPIPFRIMDQAIGFPLDIKIRCHGEYSYRITNPMLFYTNVCANIEDEFTRDQIDSQLKSELLTALQPAMFKISQNNIYYAAIPAYTMQLADELNELLSSKWRDRRGVEIVEFGVSAVNATEEDEARIVEYQRSTAMGRDANMLRGHMAGATAQAMGTAAANPNGAMAGFMGMNMAGNMMGNMGGFMQGATTTQNTMVNQQVGGMGGESPAQGGWKCECGADNSGKFCTNCGKPQPVPAVGWSCECGATNQGKFCQNCGKPKPAGAPLYKCDKCGWTPEDPANPPKFCPECGDIFDENDK